MDMRFWIHELAIVNRIAIVSWNSTMSNQTELKSDQSGWTFLTNHAHVLIYLARNAEAPLREVAGVVGITERAVQRIVAELEQAGVLRRERVGRNNRYRIFRTAKLRHPVESDHRVGELLDLLR
jgi:DNA-binding MarR family transcriptional regulator